MRERNVQEQAEHCRVVALRAYETRHLIQALEERDLTHDQALELEELLFNIPDKEE